MTREKMLLAVATADAETLARINRAMTIQEGTADKIVRPLELAKRLGVSRRTIGNLLASGQLPPVRLPGRQRVLGARESDLAALLEGRRVVA